MRCLGEKSVNQEDEFEEEHLFLTLFGRKNKRKDFKSKWNTRRKRVFLFANIIMHGITITSLATMSLIPGHEGEGENH
jgi:hypothetical protein